MASMPKEEHESLLDVSLKNQVADGEGKWRLAKACARALYKHYID